MITIIPEQYIEICSFEHTPAPRQDLLLSGVFSVFFILFFLYLC